MGAKQREFKVTATTNWEEVTDIDPKTIWESLLVENLGASDVEIAFGTTDFPDLTVRGYTSKSLSDDKLLGKCYVRHTGGFDSEIILRLWKE